MSRIFSKIDITKNIFTYNLKKHRGDRMLRHMLYLFANFLHVGLTVAPSSSYPEALEPASEAELFLAAREGDARAREKLILHNLRLVSHIIRKYYYSHPSPEDLNSIGTIGLIKAVDSFDIRNGAKFATYAARCIQNEILMHFRHEKKQNAVISINETIDVDKDGNPLTYADILGSEENIEEEIDKDIMCSKLRDSISSVLSERERSIIIKRFGLSDGKAMSQKEVAALLGISRSYVSRIEKTAIEKLRYALGIRL